MCVCTVVSKTRVINKKKTFHRPRSHVSERLAIFALGINNFAQYARLRPTITTRTTFAVNKRIKRAEKITYVYPPGTRLGEATKRDGGSAGIFLYNRTPPKR